MRKLGLLLCIAGLVASPAVAGISYSFFNITNNGNPDVGGQLLMDVSDAGGGQTLFHFTNNVGIASSIADIYFDDGALLNIASVTGSAGVNFSAGATPSNLPGGSSISPPFQTSAPTEWFSADSNPPVSANGVNSASEYLDILYNLQLGKSYADVISSLASGALRVGLHVQAIGPQSGSDSYVNNPVVPAPGAALLGIIGLSVMGWVKRRLARTA